MTERVGADAGPTPPADAAAETGTVAVADRRPAATAGREEPPLVPPALRAAVERRRAAWTPVDTIASGLIAAHLVVIVLLTAPGGLYLDDLRAQAYAQGAPFWDFVLGSNGTHFAPLPRTVDWLQSRLLPLEHAPAVVVTLLVRLWLAVAFWRLLRRLVGPRTAALAPLAVLLFTPALVPATAWFRQSLTIVACTAAMVWALDAHLRWVLDRHRRDLVTVAVATAVGLGFYEKAAILPGVFVAATLVLFVGRREIESATAAVRGLVSATASGAVVAAFALVYRAGPYEQAGAVALPTPSDILVLTWDTLTRTTFPMLLGGPYDWDYDEPYFGTFHAGDAAVTAGLVAFGAVVLLAALRDVGRTLRAVLLGAAWVFPSVTLLAVGRFADYEFALADIARMWSDLVPAVLLSLTLAVLPWRFGRVNAATAEVPAETGPPAAARSGRTITFSPTGLVGGVLVLAVVAGSLWSTASFARVWWDNPTDVWVANVRTSLETAEPAPRVLATPVPPQILPEWMRDTLPTNMQLLLLLRDDVRFNDADGPARVLDGNGVLVPVLQEQPLAQTDPAAVCLAAFPPGSQQDVRVPLPSPAVYVPGAQVEVGVLLDRAAPVDVRWERADGSLVEGERWIEDPLPAGPHRLRFAMPLASTIVAARVRGPGVPTSCVASVRAWVPVS